MKYITRILLALGILVATACTTNPAQSPSKSKQSIPAIANSDVARYLNEGLSHYSRGDYERAITRYKKALVIEPSNPIALYELGLAYMSSNKNEACIATANKALENPTTLTTLTTKLTGLLGSCHSQSGNSQQAIDLYKSGLQDSPADSELHLNIAVTYSKIRQNDQAIYHLKESIRHKPDYASPYLFLAELYRRQNRRVPAIAFLMQFVLLEPNTKRSQQAAQTVFALLNTGTRYSAGDKQAISVNLNPNDDAGAFLALDTGIQVIATQSASDESKPTIRRHIDSLNTFMKLARDFEKNGELTSTFTWQYAIKNLLKLQKRSDFNTYAYVLGEKAGSKAAGEFLDRNPSRLKKLEKSIQRL